jgi:hypothetical protein
MDNSSTEPTLRLKRLEATYDEYEMAREQWLATTLKLLSRLPSMKTREKALSIRILDLSNSLSNLGKELLSLGREGTGK